ncbi:pheromone-regulated protein PRM3 SKDI_16G0850 [Saccharomyces kudriavzevii IFO 1802]|uniref:PRM3-like protein n=1 Tax=Saccharomyces kudriavzevii (strain ATCC MYA-4449 / AS 2.2408 / CBS 8840 / NBRC 1802 / NCYC 2889) TaxID=226230 RepID=A0AA35J8P1_SACK1|nr:uncharacterized protein SKDI_16G0850 [Saccharomyces kudriavzevii IFO 1802]CAI4052917.1 hypothetical protein SKDI_16G0850 [Saccharomyces kudriavzevii IFO 1802]
MSTINDSIPPNTRKRDDDDDHKKPKEHKEKGESSKCISDLLINVTNDKALPTERPSAHSKAYTKKVTSPGRIRKHKTTTPPTKSRPKSKKKEVSGGTTTKEERGSFYQGAIFGSFLGAAVTTVLSNLAVKAFQN